MLSYKASAGQQFPLQHAPLLLHLHTRPHPRLDQEDGRPSGLQKVNDEKARILYDAIDSSGGYYNCPVDRDARSRMNVVFRLKTEELEEKFVKDAKSAGIIGVKGHRSVGGIRFSIYNANLAPNVKASADFMKDFQKRNG
jgi:phosphoserine aminotransferase